MAKRAIIRLNTQKCVLVYAFWQSNRTNVKYIIAPAQYFRPPAPKTIHTEYSFRWSIETAHRDLKQQFGLGKNQQRDAWAVWGFIGLVFFGYSIWLWTRTSSTRQEVFPFGCPLWAESFHAESILTRTASATAN